MDIGKIHSLVTLRVSHAFECYNLGMSVTCAMCILLVCMPKHCFPKKGNTLKPLELCDFQLWNNPIPRSLGAPDPQVCLLPPCNYK